MEELDRLYENGVIVDFIFVDLPYAMTNNKWDILLPLEDFILGSDIGNKKYSFTKEEFIVLRASENVFYSDIIEEWKSKHKVGLWTKIFRVLKSNGMVCMTASEPFRSYVVSSNTRDFRHEWIWLKNRGSNFANTVREPMKEHESVLCFSKGKWVYNKQMQERTGGGASRVQYTLSNNTASSSNYRDFNRPNNDQGELRVPSSWQKFNVEVGLHPTQKPVDLMRYLIRTYTNENDLVMDFTMGSGGTGVAALKENRNFLGIELNKEYFDKAQERISNCI